MSHPQEVNYLAGKEAPSSVLSNYLWYYNYSEYGIEVRSLKSLSKGSFWGRGQRVLQIISLTTLVDLIRVPKAIATD